MIDLNDVMSKLSSDINNKFSQLQHKHTQAFGGLIGDFEQQMELSLSAIEATFSFTECAASAQETM